MSSLKPIYLFADSQLLFWQSNGSPFLNSIHDVIQKPNPKAVYIGASNGDKREFYELFLAAMAAINISDCRMISAFFSEEEKTYFAQADVIVLSGGDVALGWKTFKAVGLDKAILQAYKAGALLIGVSAGAMQLGLGGVEKSQKYGAITYPMLQLVPFAVSAHQEATDWQELRELITADNNLSFGIGIPSGAGLVCHPDQTLEPIRFPSHELTLNIENQSVTSVQLWPKQTIQPK